MNIYHNLNDAVDYIEKNLFEEIDLQKAGRFIGVNAVIFNNFLSILTGYTVKQYIKLRRLSECTKLLPKYKIIDLATLCGYNNRASFSRAFKEFHRINPSQANESTNFNYFRRFNFDEENIPLSNIEIKYKDLEELTLYGEYKDISSNESIKKFSEYMLEKFPSIRMAQEYFGLVFLKNDNKEFRYYIALKERFSESNEIIKLPKSKVLYTTINQPNEQTIKSISKSMKSKTMRGYPDIEIYKKNSVDLIYKI